jgi:ketosteroid isomerase-like protein
MTYKHNFAVLVMLLAIALTAAGCKRESHAGMNQPATNDGQIDTAVRAVMDAQVAAWNRGDIDGFMEGYSNSSDTLFLSGDTLTRGWQTVMDRYKTNYNSREKMGTLAFTELEVKPINDTTAVVIGRWALTRAGDSPHGRFTLIFRLTPQGWRITHDHTS